MAEPTKAQLRAQIAPLEEKLVVSNAALSEAGSGWRCAGSSLSCTVDGSG